MAEAVDAVDAERAADASIKTLGEPTAEAVAEVAADGGKITTMSSSSEALAPPPIAPLWRRMLTRVRTVAATVDDASLGFVADDDDAE